MTIIDYSTPEGKLRMRLGDTSDLPFLPGSVYSAVYAEHGGNLFASVKELGLMILAQLSFKTHRKMGLQLEVWGKEAYDSYSQFLLMTVSNPAFMDLSPMPYSATSGAVSPIIQFQNAWNDNFVRGTENQQLNLNALYSPNDNSTYGPWPVASSEGL